MKEDQDPAGKRRKMGLLLLRISVASLVFLCFLYFLYKYSFAYLFRLGIKKPVFMI